MANQSSRRQGANSSVREVAWPARSGRLPVIADFVSPRPETGHGLDSGLPDLVPGSGGYPTVTVLAGPSGSGKTYLAAAALAGTDRAARPDLQVWVNASSPSAVVTGYARAAADIGLAERGMQPEAAAARLLDWLTTSRRTWLVVLDNVTDPAGLRGLWPMGSTGQVLVTCSQSADLSLLAEFSPRVCQIGDFSPREALGYLTARMYDDADKRAEALDLAGDLGYSPLALALATATMAGTAISCRQYRLRYASRRQELLGRAADGSVSPADVAWSLALDRADQRPPSGLARPVLALIALLDPAGVPVQVAASRAGCAYLSGPGRAIQADHSDVLAAISSLAQTGLVTIDQSDGHELVAVHPVVQESVRRLIPGVVLDQAARAAADAIDEAWPASGSDPALEHALRGCAGWLGGIAGDLLWLPEPHPVLIRTGVSLGESGLSGPAIAYWTSLLGACSRALGPDHPRTLAIRDLLLDACEAAGRIDDALDLAMISVAEHERVQGADHPDALTARIALVRIYRAKGMYDHAMDVCERVAADREWVLGGEHPDTLLARRQLASTCLLAGQVDRAIAIFRRNLADWERVAGPDHTETVAEYLSLGRACQAAGRMDEAIAIFSRVQGSREASLGHSHPETATATSYLASAYRTSGRLKDATALYRRVLAGREAALGPDHPDTLAAEENLASCHVAAHRLKEAIPLYERLLADRTRVQGPDHRDTLTTRGNLASAYHSAGRLVEALPAYEQTLADFERVLGPDHPDTLTSRANLANAYYAARRQSDAIKVFKRTIADCERALGPDHPLTRTISDNLETITRLPVLDQTLAFA